MRTAFRIFVADKAGVIRRFPSSRYGRLHERPSTEILPEFAGEWVRFAELVVELENRRPTRVLRSFYVRMKMDPAGKPDAKEMDAVFRLSADAAELDLETESGLIRGGRHWARKKLEERFRWKPTPFEERTIRRMALSCGRGR